LCCSARICVLVPSADLQRSSWARDIVGDDSWIEWEGSGSSAEDAWQALQAWLQRSPGSAVNGVMTYDEFGVELASFLGERLGVSSTPLEHVRCFRDKSLFRERCRTAGVPCVGFAQIRTPEDVDRVLASDVPRIRFPCVLKPVKGAGSWHVMKIHHRDELRETFVRLYEEMRGGAFPQDVRDGGFVLEEYFGGHEVDIDGWACNGEVGFSLVSDNRPALEPHFLEMGGIYPSQLPIAAVNALELLTKQVVAAFPGMHSCFHFEAKVNPETFEVMPIELNARCGGAECPASVEAVSGYYLPEVAARLALGLDVLPRSPKYGAVASTNIHIFEAGVVTECSDSELDAAACNLVTCVLTGCVGQPHVPNSGSLSCLGWLAAGGADAADAERHLQEALSQVRIAVSPQDDKAV